MGATNYTSGELVTLSAEKQKKLSKIDQKRMAAREERRRRLINKGVPEDKVELMMAQEDFQALPIAEQLLRTRNALEMAIQMLARDIHSLRHNENVLADSMDVNFRAFSKLLTKLGVSAQDQKAAVEEAERELHEEKLASARAKREQNEQQMAQSEADAIRKEGIDANGSPVADELPPVTPPDGATVFGD